MGCLLLQIVTKSNGLSLVAARNLHARSLFILDIETDISDDRSKDGEIEGRRKSD